MRPVHALSIALTCGMLCMGCGLLLDLDADGDDGSGTADGTVPGDGGPAARDAGGGRVDGSTRPLDGSNAADAAHVTDASGVRDASGIRDGSSGAVDGTAPRIDAGPCTDDTREDDDDLIQAMAHGTVNAPVPGLVIFNLVSCPGDDDMVHAYSDCCEDERGAVVRYDPADGRLALEALGEDGTSWPLSATEVSPGHLELLSVGDGGLFYVVVRNLSGTPVPYLLTVYAPVYL